MRGRRLASVLLVVLTCFLTLISALALWLRALVLDTDSYVRAIGPVLDQPAVRDALAGTIVDELYNHVDVTAQLKSALPKNAAVFAPTLAAGIRTTSVQIASAALATSAVRTAWRQANRVAHAQIVRVLEGKGTIVTTAKGQVAINTGPLAAAVRQALDANNVRLFDAVPTSALNQQFVLFRSTDLTHAQLATRVLDDLATWLPLLTIAAGAGAIACATRRRRAVAFLAAGIAAVMVLISVGAEVGRAYYLARVGASYRTIAAAPFDALVGPLRGGVRVTFVLALVALLVALFAGSELLVGHERHARAMAIDLFRRYARPLAVAGALLAAVVLVAWGRPRPLVVYLILAGLVAWEVACLTVGRTPSAAGANGSSEEGD